MSRDGKNLAKQLPSHLRHSGDVASLFGASKVIFYERNGECFYAMATCSPQYYEIKKTFSIASLNGLHSRTSLRGKAASAVCASGNTHAWTQKLYKREVCCSEGSI